MTERDDNRAADDGKAAAKSDADTGDGGDSTRDADADHLDDIEDGVGCTEIWERLSEQRED
jgi:hypothetical protein